MDMRPAWSEEHETSPPHINRPVISRSEWMKLSPEERIKRFAKPSHQLSRHPSVGRLRGLKNAQCEKPDPKPASDDTSTVSSRAGSPDYAARAARIRMAVQERLRVRESLQARVQGQSRLNPTFLDFEALPMIPEGGWRISLPEALATTGGIILGDTLSYRQSKNRDSIPSLGKPPVAAGLRRKPLPVETTSLGTQVWPTSRKILAEKSTNHADAGKHAFVDKAKAKAAVLKRKVKRTFEVWRGE